MAGCYSTKGETSRRSKVTEITHLVDMTSWPDNTRSGSTPCAQGRPHRSAQPVPLRNYRYQAFCTTLKGDPAAVGTIMPGIMGVVEQTIADLKDNGLKSYALG